MNQVTAMYFSPTGTSKKITEAIARGMGGETRIVDLTRSEARQGTYEFGHGDILVLGYPVYGGRIPTILQDVIHAFKGNESIAVPAAIYGNRDYEDALLEGVDILTESGFVVPAAGAFIGEHSYTSKVATGRPDVSDLKLAEEFGSKIADKLQQGDTSQPAVKGNRPYKDPMPDMPFTPQITGNCINCGSCADNCPAGAIDKNNPAMTNSSCILCCACVKICPQHAKSLDAEPIHKIRTMLEANCIPRREPELYL